MTAMRRCCLFLVAWAVFIAIGRAQAAPSVVIVKATYGAPGQTVDVSGVLTKSIAAGKYVVNVNNDELGGDPAPGIAKQLVVEYTLNGTSKKATVYEEDSINLLTGAIAGSVTLFSAGHINQAALLQPFVDDNTVPGVVALIATRNKVLDVAAVGWADVDRKIPMHADDLFWLASLSKGITASAVMILVDEGKVNLDDPVDKYLPEFEPQWYEDKQDTAAPLKHPTHKITVRNLLTHTSGLLYNTPLESPSLDMIPLKDRIPSYAASTLQFDPGTKFGYSTAGINTAGRIIEVVSGMPYEQFMQTRLFAPLGMTHSTFKPLTKDLPNIAQAYKANPGGGAPWVTGQFVKLHYPLDDPARQPVPGVGLFSSASDIAKFCQMLLNNGVSGSGQRILSEAAVKEMTTKQTPPVVKQNYGLGLEIYGTGFGHGGTGYSFMYVNPAKNIVTVFLEQMVSLDQPRWDKMRKGWNSAVAGMPPQH